MEDLHTTTSFRVLSCC